MSCRGLTRSTGSAITIDPACCLQSFAEKLFTQLNVRYKKETWETRLAMITVTARVIGVHKLIMDEKYYASYLNLVQPRQRDVTHVLAALIMVQLQSCPLACDRPIVAQAIMASCSEMFKQCSAHRLRSCHHSYMTKLAATCVRIIKVDDSFHPKLSTSQEGY